MMSFNPISHLYRRAGFGLSPQEWIERRHWTKNQAIQQLFSQAIRAQQKPIGTTRQVPEKQVFQLMSEEEKKQFKKKGKQLQVGQVSDWMARMASPQESCLLEKMTLFWHGHFACVIKGQPHLSQQYLQTLRQHALGNFRELVLAVAQTPAMIRFLNNQQNKKRKPNENFARELMELFTIGRGNYTEQDIKNAARAFTGWSSNFKGEYVFRTRQHDYGQKTFMGKTGNFNGEDIIDILLAQEKTAVFVARKMYRFFVNDQPNEQHINQLAKRFFQNNYNIQDTLRFLFTQDWFYDTENTGNKIKSPLELLAGMMRTFGVKIEKPTTSAFMQKALGQLLFHPPNVAGWPGGKAWIDHSTLMLRLNLTGFLFQATEVSFKVKEDLKSKKRNRVVRKIEASIDLPSLIQVFASYSDEALFQQLNQYLLAAPAQLPHDFFADFIIQQNQEDRIKSLVLRLTSLPEYQVC